MKKFIAFCLLAVNIAVSAFAAEIPYIGRVQPEYRAAAEGYLIEATSPQDVERRVKNYVPAQSSITFETVNAKSLYGAADVPLYIYPMLDYRTATENSPYHAQQTGYICWPRSSNKYAWEVLRGGKNLSGKILGYYSPTFAEDFANLPPAFIYVGGLDLFVNEDIDYAAKLTEANVDTELHVIPGLYHAFEIAAPEAEQSKIFWQRVYAFSAEKLAAEE